MPTDTGATPASTPPRRSGRTGARRLVRFPHEGPLGGVCAGVADYLDIDPTIVRIAAVVLAITGPGIPAYALAWIFVPAADGHMIAPWPHDRGYRHDRTAQIIGIGAIAIVFSVLWGSWWRPAHGWFVPVGLIAFGAWLLLRDRDEDDAGGPPRPGPGYPPPWQPPAPGAPSSVKPARFPPAGVTEPPSLADTSVTDPFESTAAVDVDPTEPSDPYASTSSSSYQGRPRRRRVLGPVVFGALLLWGGLAWLFGIGAQDGLAVGLCLVGAGFVVGAFVGGSKILILPALLITAALIVASTIDIPITSGIGDRTWRISSVSDLDPSYSLGIGGATLDLRNLVLTSGTRVDIAVKLGIGELNVEVPDTVSVFVTTKMGAGNNEVFGHQDSGSSVTTSRAVTGTADGGAIHLDLRVGVGHILVTRGPATTSFDTSTRSPQLTTPPTSAGGGGAQARTARATRSWPKPVRIAR